MEIGISLLEYYVPDNRLNVFDFFRIMKEQYNYKKSDSDIEDFVSMSGHKEITVENEKNRVEMIETLFKRVFLGKMIDPASIDYVVFTVEIADNYIDKAVYQLYFIEKYKLINSNYIVFNQQCGTQLPAMDLVDSLIRTGKANRVLMVSHNYAKDINRRLIEGYGVIGDGAAMALIDKDSDRLKIKSFVTEVNSKYFDLKETPKTGLEYYGYLDNGITSFKKLLKQNDLSLDDIRLIIPQNINFIEWEYYTSKLKYPIEKVFLNNISRFGHVGDTDTFINLKDSLHLYDIKPKDNLLLQSVGAGASFNSLWIEA